MNLQIIIDYATSYGEELILNILKKTADRKEEIVRNKMQTNNGQQWKCNLKLDMKTMSVLDYYYSVEHKGIEVRREWRLVPHRLDIVNAKTENYQIIDRWIDMPENAFLYSSAFTDCINRHAKGKMLYPNQQQMVQLKVRAPQLRSNERLVLTGSERILGEWRTSHAVEMKEHAENEWVAYFDARKLRNRTIEYKFAILNGDDTSAPLWESGNNRILTVPKMNNGDAMIYELPEAHFTIDAGRVAGTLVPVFSLRSETSFGVGDFGDLRKMVDWAAETRQRIIQVLPINDTTMTHTWVDSYPYSSISIFALHPQYADLNALPPLADKDAQTRFEALRKELNALPQMDYERVNKAKKEYLYLLYIQEGKRMMATSEFKHFFLEEERWLVPYAQYCHLRDLHGTADFSQWGENQQWKESNRTKLSTPRNKCYQDIAFYYFVQFVLTTQMKAVHDYARQKGIILKGDIPIGVNRNGCDVWQEPHYFNLNGQAGAPPDYFSVNGQNWGFPTYNWDEMLKDGCQWWIRRFTNMSKYFDAYRIDHVLGFFRIWEIPTEYIYGIAGHFSPALGMTRKEIESYGLKWQEQLFTEPFIMDWTLERMFGERAGEVKNTYLERTGDGHYRMRKAYNTQRKIEKAFEKRTTQDDINLREGLCALLTDVLFVRDHKEKNKFHPRINVQSDFIYESLWDSDKAIFNQIYNDYFYRRNNQFWYEEAMKKLPKLVEATRMLVCAEDLGMVPDCVPWVMDQLRILSLELQAMPKNPNDHFGDLTRNPYRSVCTISSHDMATLRQWWEENWQRTQEYYNTMLHRQGPAPHPLPGQLAHDIIASNLFSPSMLCIISIQDWLAMDEKLRLADADAERINIPSNPKHYWRYRMHLNIEDLMKAHAFNDEIAGLINQSGRV